MTALFVYILIAILILVVLAWLARETQTSEPGDAATRQYALMPPGNGQFLKISDRIFDSGDFLWLRDAVGRPDLARTLARSRQRLAVQWLEILKDSFHELVRTPEPASLQGNANPGPGSWELLWLTVRFHLLLAYALLAVRIFGPYHRLVPFPNWRQFLPQPTSHKSRFSTVDS